MRIGNYQLGDCLGRGAFGSVFRGLNWTSGETVAVKQIRLGNIPPAELKEITAEIDLLKNLRHPNIVKYKGSEKTREYLYIILEYCENGSLQHICKRFGKFPEGLVGIYVSQVLQGLIYLHEQGVIHRDIKGANILTTKDGSVKLADFGVATKTTSLASNNAVVGSPYWMAPEVIDQSGATTASDIWSVGAVVVELLDGKPPYHYLDPMPALFRIVQDDCPPLPDGASPVVKDFLMQCFQKDVNLRVSAKKLSRHPWMLSSRRESKGSSSGSSLGSHAQAVKSVQEWNEALREPVLSGVMNTAANRTAAPIAIATQGKGREESSDATDVSKRKSRQTQEGCVMRETNLNTPVRPPRRHVLTQVQEPCSTSELSQIIQSAPTNRARQTENWDEDFEGGISDSLVAALSSETCGMRGHEKEEDEFATIKAHPPSYNPKAPPMIAMVKSDGRKSPLKSRLAGSVIDVDDLPRIQDTVEENIRQPLKVPNLLRYMEDPGGDDFSGIEFGVDQAAIKPLQLASRYTMLPTVSDLDDDGEVIGDPFAEIEQEAKAEIADFEANIARDKHARLCAHTIALFDKLKATTSEDILIEVCDELEILLAEHSEQKAHALAAHGALAIIELLGSIEIRDIVTRLLGLLNVIVYNDLQAQESLCLVGAIPIAMPFCSKRYPHHVRVEAAHFIFTMCSSEHTLQFLLSCRGLKTLVNLVDDDYTQQSDLIWLGIACIHGVLDLQSPVSRSDFCRMLAKEGLLEPLSGALLSVVVDKDAGEQADLAIDHIIQILLIYSSSELILQQQLTERIVFRRLLQASRTLKAQMLTKLLKVIKNLTMSPSLLDSIENCNSIEMLIHILADSHSGPFGTEISNQILSAMYNLCRLNLRRQEEAAQAGLIPHLVRIAKTSTPLKQFALPILCDMAHASKSTRKTLSQQCGINFFLELLQDLNWQSQALESICVWLASDFARIEEQLLRPSALHVLLLTFASSKSTAYETLLETYLKIFKISQGMTLALGRQPLLLRRLMERLQMSSKALVRLNTLRVCKAVCDAHPDVHDVVRQVGLLPIIQKLSRDDSAVLVRELAREITTNLEGPSLAPSMIAKDAQRTVRRAASETNVSWSPSQDERSSRRKRLPPLASHRTLDKASSKLPSTANRN